jgi:hypothetical protein
MAFKSVKRESVNYDTIESLFWDLNTSSKIQSLFTHQTDILRHYESKGIDKPNVALELPTGSGKTIVGLLVGEFRRRTKGDRVLYLCPTRQLVNQVVELANNDYGIGAVAFTGSKSNYSPEKKIAYNNSEAIAVTTYSSLFNVNPWFDDPDLIIIDDAHSAENYIPSTWSVEIQRGDNYKAYRAVVDVFKNHLDYNVYKTIINDEGDNIDRNRVEKIPNTVLFDKKEQLFDVLSTYIGDHPELKWGWMLIQNSLEACQVFFTWRDILIRPLIPPTFTNKPFNRASQKIFMSATLGEGGDLERIMGIEKIYKIPIPEGWDKRGMGRRLFMFPELSLGQEEIGQLMSDLLIRNNRTVILVSSDSQVGNFRKELALSHPDISFFTAKDIEVSKTGFVTSDKAAIVLANRFDGIDFAEDQSRLLFLVGIPYASNLQEKFFQSRMGAEIIFNDRNRTRLVQAIGRCTRSPRDYSVICVLGEKDLAEWLVLDKKSKFLHPELQAELQFGITNSRNISIDNFLENFEIFLAQDKSWNTANQEIIKNRASYEKANFEGSEQLEKAANLEVKFQSQLWNKLYKEALETVLEIISKLSGGSTLKGYRAYWHYIAGTVCHYLYKETLQESYLQKRDEYFEKLIKIYPNATWSRGVTDIVVKDLSFDDYLVSNIETLQEYVSDVKIQYPHKYNKYLKQVDDYIDSKDLESLNLHIGLLLGYNAKNPESTGSPDPYWISNNKLVIVFEDKLYQSTDDYIPLNDIRQAVSHEEWISANVTSDDQSYKIVTVLISNRDKIEKVSHDLCKDLLFWSYEDFVNFSRKVISLARQYRVFYSGENDSNWKDYFLDEFHKNQMGPNQIIKSLIKVKALYKE